MLDFRDGSARTVRWCLVVVLTLLMLALWSGCAPLTLEQRLRVRAESTRVCIRNETAAMGNLRGWADGFGKRFDVMSGSEQCALFPATGQEMRVYVETIGGSMWGPTRSVASFRLNPGDCWDWAVRNDQSADGILRCPRRSAKWGL